MELNEKQLTEEDALRVIRDMQQQRFRLTQEAAATAVQNHRKTILRGFKYDLEDEKEYELHARMIKYIGDTLMLREFSSFQIDEHNKDVLRFLTYYFNGCKLAESVFPNENYKIYKNLLIIGNPGTGKTMLMQIFSEYLKATKKWKQRSPMPLPY